jgi:hypothetical protein
MTTKSQPTPIALPAVPLPVIVHSPMATMDKMDTAVRPRVMVTRLRVRPKVKDTLLKVKVTHPRATSNSSRMAPLLHP